MTYDEWRSTEPSNDGPSYLCEKCQHRFPEQETFIVLHPATSTLFPGVCHRYCDTCADEEVPKLVFDDTAT